MEAINAPKKLEKPDQLTQTSQLIERVMAEPDPVQAAVYVDELARELREEVDWRRPLLPSDLEQLYLVRSLTDYANMLRLASTIGMTTQGATTEYLREEPAPEEDIGTWMQTGFDVLERRLIFEEQQELQTQFVERYQQVVSGESDIDVTDEQVFHVGRFIHFWQRSQDMHMAISAYQRWLQIEQEDANMMRLLEVLESTESEPNLTQQHIQKLRKQIDIDDDPIANWAVRPGGEEVLGDEEILQCGIRLELISEAQLPALAKRTRNMLSLAGLQVGILDSRQVREKVTRDMVRINLRRQLATLEHYGGVTPTHDVLPGRIKHAARATGKAVLHAASLMNFETAPITNEPKEVTWHETI